MAIEQPITEGARGQGPYLRVEDVARRLHCSVRTIHELTRCARIPHRRLPGSRRCLFREDELEAWEDGAELELIERSGGRIVRPKRARPSYSIRTREDEDAANAGTGCSEGD
jgi:excisionase family DNA binding protein